MNTKQKLAYIAIGGLLVATGMIISPLNAQKDKFGEIECESLKVVSDEGDYAHITGSAIILTEKSPRKFTIIIPGYANLGSADSTIRIRDDSVELYDAEKKEMVGMGIGKYGGYVQTNGRSKGYAIMGISKKGNGAVSIYDKNGYILK